MTLILQAIGLCGNSDLYMEYLVLRVDEIKHIDIWI